MEETDFKVITRTDGKPYTVRRDRRRYFYPDEWDRFYDALRDKNKPLFDFLINTGARIDEAVHIRPMDFDFARNNVRLWKTKTKAKKGETQGKPRTISLSSKYCRRAAKACNGKKPDEYLWMTSTQAANCLMKRTLKRIGVKDPYNFSLHNIRKSSGMWLKSIGVGAEEICLRLGHDYNTYLSHYGSADIFSDKDVRRIEAFYDDLYRRVRRV